ncbi:ROK family protein [Candidatus Merdisoma sp. JLR.KK006]|jgi:glucokinase|uniref:ROK family protein n=1 Tax=Candidatus Merdisoma sp. JLR.KK006 TaxID=3112626 RepID=UPI002FF08BBC
MEKKYIFGIDAGGTKVAYGLFDRAGELLDRYQHPTDIEADGPAFSDRVIATIKEILEKNHASLEEVYGIGICMPSYIRFETGYIHMTSAMVNIQDFGMRDYMEERLGVKVILDNDSNVAALAEHRRGAGRDCKDMVYMAVSTGIGSGIIINRDVFRGSYGWAGESGHMLDTPDAGIMCGCGNYGCFMSQISGRNLPKRLAIRMLKGKESLLSQAEELNGEALLKAYEAGDELAREEIEHMAHHLAVCVYNVYQLLNINVFVFGGGLTNFGDILFGRVREEFDRYDHIKMPVEFRFAELKKDFGIIGAAELLR